MPHCVIEYSKDLENYIHPSTLISAVFSGTLSSGLFKETDIKIRSLPFELHQTGKVKSDFIHTTLKILEGRSKSERSNLSHLVLNKLKSLNLKSLSLTVQIIEIEKDSYSKVVLT